MEFTPDFIKTALAYRHPNYKLTKDLAEPIRIHAYGLFPDKLISERRPNESLDTLKYRKSIYEPFTQETIGKVFTELQKIRRSQDWNVMYNDSDIPKIITEDETLEKYCEINYPGFGSVTNWAFSELLQRYLIDANSICALTINKLPGSFNEYLKPTMEIFSSEQVLDYVEDKYVVLLSADKNIYYAGNNRMYQGDIFYFISDTQILRYKQVTGKYDIELDLEYNHDLGYLPAFKAGGEHFMRVNNTNIYKSRIHYMIPALNEAAREGSDLQAEIVQHIHSEKYYFANTECPNCGGFSKDNIDKRDKCQICKGSGVIPNTSPYGTMIIDVKQSIDGISAGIPAVPAGYIQKNTDIAVLQDERIKKHLYKALSAINMEFLSSVQLNQSGTAKEVDRDALNTFINSIAEDIVRILDKVYRIICDIRYSVLIPNADERYKLLPKIAVPEKFDILSSTYFMQEIIQSEGKINSYLKMNLEMEYARKRYNAMPEVIDRLETMFELDPFYGVSQDELIAMFANNGITELDYIISCNIEHFITKAVNSHSDFLNMAYDQKRKIIEAYANEVISVNNVANSIKRNISEEVVAGLSEDNSGAVTEEENVDEQETE